MPDATTNPEDPRTSMTVDAGRVLRDILVPVQLTIAGLIRLDDQSATSVRAGLPYAIEAAGHSLARADDAIRELGRTASPALDVLWDLRRSVSTARMALEGLRVEAPGVRLGSQLNDLEEMMLCADEGIDSVLPAVAAEAAILNLLGQVGGAMPRTGASDHA
ncbi:MAG: hypothetical protein OEZ65_17050 [Gemmatimonadota bacterium]|nr:hypothetical protein [Gemmatimonadota bacterium]